MLIIFIICASGIAVIYRYNEDNDVLLNSSTKGRYDFKNLKCVNGYESIIPLKEEEELFVWMWMH